MKGGPATADLEDVLVSHEVCLTLDRSLTEQRPATLPLVQPRLGEGWALRVEFFGPPGSPRRGHLSSVCGHHQRGAGAPPLAAGR